MGTHLELPRTRRRDIGEPGKRVGLPRRSVRTIPRWPLLGDHHPASLDRADDAHLIRRMVRHTRGAPPADAREVRLRVSDVPHRLMVSSAEVRRWAP